MADGNPTRELTKLIEEINKSEDHEDINRILKKVRKEYRRLKNLNVDMSGVPKISIKPRGNIDKDETMRFEGDQKGGRRRTRKQKGAGNCIRNCRRKKPQTKTKKDKADFQSVATEEMTEAELQRLERELNDLLQDQEETMDNLQDTVDNLQDTMDNTQSPITDAELERELDDLLKGGRKHTRKQSGGKKKKKRVEKVKACRTIKYAGKTRRKCKMVRLYHPSDDYIYYKRGPNKGKRNRIAERREVNKALGRYVRRKTKKQNWWNKWLF